MNAFNRLETAAYVLDTHLVERSDRCTYPFRISFSWRFGQIGSHHVCRQRT